MMLMFLISVILSANINYVTFAKLTALFKGFQVVHDHVQYDTRRPLFYDAYMCIWFVFPPKLLLLFFNFIKKPHIRTNCLLVFFIGTFIIRVFCWGSMKSIRHWELKFKTKTSMNWIRKCLRQSLSHCRFIIFSEMMRCCANGEITTFIYNVPLAQSFNYCRWAESPTRFVGQDLISWDL